MSAQVVHGPDPGPLRMDGLPYSTLGPGPLRSLALLFFSCVASSPDPHFSEWTPDTSLSPLDLPALAGPPSHGSNLLCRGYKVSARTQGGRDPNPTGQAEEGAVTVMGVWGREKRSLIPS